MATRMRAPFPRAEADQAEADQADANRITASLAGLAAALLFVVLGLVLVNHLYDEGRVEDCLMSGRNNCDQLIASSAAYR